MRFAVLGIVAALGLSAFGAAFAHDTYLMPERGWSGAKLMTVLLTSSEQFPRIEYGPKKARVVQTFAVGPDEAAQLSVAHEGAKALKLSLFAKRPGAYAVGVALGPRDIELTPTIVAHYFDEVDAPKDVRDAYSALPEPRVWKESYEKFAKALVCAQQCGSKQAFAKSTGLAAEFVAVEATLGTKQPAFRLLKAGAPVADQPVAIVTKSGQRTMLRTSASGEIALPAGLKGPVLLSAVMLKPPAGTGAPFTSMFVSLTFDSGLLSR